MPCTADCHHPIAHTRFPQSARVLDDAAALHAAVDGLDADPAPREPSMGRLLSAREGSASGLFGGPADRDWVERARQDAEILAQPAARGPGIGCGVCHPPVVGAPPIGVAQSSERARGSDEPPIVHRVACFLTAITARRLNRSLGTLDAPFGPVMPNRGAGATGGGAAAGGLAGDTGSAGGTTMAAAAVSATPRRVASAAQVRAGASPQACRATRRTTNRRWRH
jgi:hypothetical protein